MKFSIALATLALVSSASAAVMKREPQFGKPGQGFGQPPQAGGAQAAKNKGGNANKGAGAGAGAGAASASAAAASAAAAKASATASAATSASSAAAAGGNNAAAASNATAGNSGDAQSSLSTWDLSCLINVKLTLPSQRFSSR